VVLPPANLDRLIAGLPFSFDDARQEVVYEPAYALVQPPIVSQGLCERAKDPIGDAGIVGVIVLIGPRRRRARAVRHR
jgi:4-carboxymuconolactone decarboxylase